MFCALSKLLIIDHACGEASQNCGPAGEWLSSTAVQGLSPDPGESTRKFLTL